MKAHGAWRVLKKILAQSRVCISSLNPPTTLSCLFQAMQTTKSSLSPKVKVLSELIKEIAFCLK